MNQLTCEMCGSTDLLKSDGVFTCQNCGCKYSVEEAKKMMVEGVVQVEGTVKVDNTAQIENYLAMAQKAHDSDNEAEAESYANKVLEIDPNNWEALFIKGLAAGWQSNSRNNRISEAYDYFSQAIQNCDSDDSEMLKENVADSALKLAIAAIRLHYKNYASFPSKGNAVDVMSESTASLARIISLASQCDIAVSEFKANAATLINNAAVSGWKKIWDDYTTGKPLQPLDKKGKAPYHSTDRSLYAQPSKYEWNQFTERADACLELLQYTITLNSSNNKDNAIRYESLIYIGEKVRDSCSIDYLQGNQYCRSEWCRHWKFTDEARATRQSEIDSWNKEKIAAEKAARKDEAEKYWKDHPTEKCALNKEIESTKTAISKKKEDETYIEIKQKSTEYDRAIAKLEEELKSCGLFEGKKKKELKSQIEAKRKEQKPLKDKVDLLGEEIATLNKKLDELSEKLLNPPVD